MGIKQSLRMMVVDDMSTSRGILTQSLDEMGIQKYQVENDGKVAFEKLVKSPVHLVLSDYNMPGMDGLQLLRALRENKSTSRIGFILISGKLTQEIVTLGQKLGANNMIKKPATTASLRQCIEKVVGRL